jgi:hypothetical protein
VPPFRPVGASLVEGGRRGARTGESRPARSPDQNERKQQGRRARAGIPPVPERRREAPLQEEKADHAERTGADALGHAPRSL